MRLIFSDKSERNLRFLIAGGIGVFFYQSILIGLTEVGLWYVLSAAIAFAIYFCLSFPLQKYWVFRNKSRQYIRVQFIQFAFVAIPHWIASTWLLWYLVEYYHYWYLPVTLTLTAISAFLALVIFTYIFRHRT